MKFSSRRLPVVCAVLAVFAAACTSVPDSELVEAPSGPWAYERQVYMPGLDETVTVRKSARWTWAFRPDGTSMALSALELLDAQRSRARFGAVHPAFAKKLAARDPGAVTKAGFVLNVAVPWNNLKPRLTSRDHRVRQDALAELKAILAPARNQARAALAAHGLKVVGEYETFPGLVVEGQSRSILSAAKSETVAVVVSAEATSAGGGRHSSAPKNGVSDPHVDIEFNQRGFFGLGQKIGFVEDNAAGLWERHEAFVFVEPNPSNGNRVIYQQEPRDCRDDDDCKLSDGFAAGRCLDIGHPGHSTQCVTVHASECASVAVGSVDGDMHGAAKAQVYYPNGDAYSDTNVCKSPASLLNAYNFLATQGVTTVNESWACYGVEYADAATLEGLTQDWYARYFDIAIFKSAGNQATGEDEPACPFSLNSTCVGAAALGGGSATCYSSYRNFNGAAHARTDREEPDIMAFGGTSTCGSSGVGVDVMKVEDDDNDWVPADGTSFAAPAVAAIAALCKEASGGSRSALSVRAILKASAFERNPEDYRYSTTSDSFTVANDWIDGAGGTTAKPVYSLCAGVQVVPGAVGGTAEYPGKLVGDPWPYGVGCDACGHNDPPLGGLSVGTKSYVGPSPTDNRLYRMLFSTDLVPGNRVRVAIAWDSCPGSDRGRAPSAIATDYDLFLVDHESGAIYSSQSLSDVTEGFDVTLPPGSRSGKYDVLVGFPSDARGCSGFVTGFEPFAVATWLWGPPTAPEFVRE